MKELLQKKKTNAIPKLNKTILEDRKKIAHQLKKAAELHLHVANKFTLAAERLENYKEDSAIQIASEAYALVKYIREAQRLLLYETL